MQRLFGLIALATIWATTASAQQLHVVLHSPPGEWIGDGQNWDITYTPVNTSSFVAVLSAYNSAPLPNYLEFYTLMPGAQDNLFLAFIGTNQLGHELRPGIYQQAERAPFASPGHPGLDVAFQHRGSNEVAGSFVIDSVAYHYGNFGWLLDSFSASFTQYSDGEPNPLTGTITYSAVPEPATSAVLGLGVAALARKRRRSS